jgi:hypothetical protein
VFFAKTPSDPALTASWETLWFLDSSKYCQALSCRIDDAAGDTSMTTVRSSVALPLIACALVAQTSDFRNTSWGMDRAQVVAAEAAPPSQILQRGSEIVLRYDSARLAGLVCRVVYILAKDKLVRAKYVFQREHDEKNDFLADFTMVDAFLMGIMERPTEQRVMWRDEVYKKEPQHYGVAVSLGQLLYSTQWKGMRTVVTHALTGENGTITHEIEYVSVDLEPWEDQITREQESPAVNAPRTLQSAAVPQN